MHSCLINCIVIFALLFSSFTSLAFSFYFLLYHHFFTVKYQYLSKHQIGSLHFYFLTLIIYVFHFRPHYNVVTKGIEVNGEALNIPTTIFDAGSNRGTIIDSGTTLAYLPNKVYDALMSKVGLDIWKLHVCMNTSVPPAWFFILSVTVVDGSATRSDNSSCRGDLPLLLLQ